MNKLLLLVLLLAFPSVSEAATLYLSPSSGTFEVGKNYSVSVYLSSSDQAANAVSASVSVASDLFNLISVSSAGSIVNFWVSEPKVSGSTMSFEGVILNPGYQGTGGKVATLTLSPRKAGTGAVSFGSASVLANDGKGTNILSGSQGASFTTGAAATPVAAPAATPTTSAPAAPETPSAFSILSSTHPDQSTWYRASTGTFSWDVPENASATRLVLSSSKTAAPSVEYVPAVAQKTIESLPEGVSYLRVQHKANGVWGGVATYRIQTDTTPPERFVITFPHGATGVDPQPIILFNTVDDLSGVDHYDVRVGEGDLLAMAAPADSNPYVLPLQEPGTHVVAVTATDKAGNSTTVAEGFNVEGIDAPKITYYEESIPFGDLVKIRGLSYPNADIEVYVREGTELIDTKLTRSNAIGDFATILAKRLDPGTYTLSARAIDARGARSFESERVTIQIQGGLLSDIGFFVRDHAGVSSLIFLVLVACLLIHIYGWRRLLKMTHGVHAQRIEAAGVVHKAFSILKKDVTSHMRNIRAAGQSRMLTKEEIEFLEEFEGELEDAEGVVEEEIKKARER
ncbi:MAG: hypothetical protein KBD05_00275 [Candidatus Pacebacteria bacterium]|nr:hypothetical protein [Candidatus Paceibacterota bacterium]